MPKMAGMPGVRWSWGRCCRGLSYADRRASKDRPVSARALIDAAVAEGLTLGVEGRNLVIETDRDPPAALIALLREHKAALIAVLSDDPEERAAIVAEGAGVPRAWA